MIAKHILALISFPAATARLSGSLTCTVYAVLISICAYATVFMRHVHNPDQMLEMGWKIERGIAGKERERGKGEYA